jgi:hypothetical protein
MQESDTLTGGDWLTHVDTSNGFLFKKTNDKDNNQLVHNRIR